MKLLIGIGDFFCNPKSFWGPHWKMSAVHLSDMILDESEPQELSLYFFMKPSLGGLHSGKHQNAPWS